MNTPDSESFYLRGGRVGCLLLHGFTATPQEMRGLGEVLHAAGHTAHGVRIAGHGTSVADLARTSWQDWLGSACAGLAALQRETDTVVAVGLSMGSLLALALAHERPREVHGVVALSTALWIREERLERYLAALRLASAALPKRWQHIPKKGRDIADPTARATSPAYDAMPLRSLVNLIQLQRHTRALVPAIQQPVLAMHARQDHTCPERNVRYLAERLPRPPHIEWLDRSYHVITVDYDRDQVAARTRDFAAAVAAQATTATLGRVA